MSEQVVVTEPHVSEMKWYAVRIFNRGKLVAECPLIIHDLDAAIEAVEFNFAEVRDIRAEIAPVFAMLLSARTARDLPQPEIVSVEGVFNRVSISRPTTFTALQINHKQL